MYQYNNHDQKSMFADANVAFLDEWANCTRFFNFSGSSDPTADTSISDRGRLAEHLKIFGYIQMLQWQRSFT